MFDARTESCTLSSAWRSARDVDATPRYGWVRQAREGDSFDDADGERYALGIPERGGRA